MTLVLVRPILLVLVMFQQAAGPAAQSIQFHDVDMNSKTGEIRFDPFQSVDWRRLAERDMKDFSLSHPTPEQVSRGGKIFAGTS